MSTYFALTPTEDEGFYKIEYLQSLINTEFPFNKFCNELKISKYYCQRRTEEVLEHLTAYFDYDFIKGERGTSSKIIIKEVLSSYYETLEHEKQAAKALNQAIRINDYWDFAKSVIQKRELTSLSQIARLAEIDDELRDKYPISAATIQKLLRDTFKNNTIRSQPTWVWRQTDWGASGYAGENYIPLTDEQLDYLKKCFKEKNLLWQNILTTIGENDLGYYDKTERDEKILKSVHDRYEFVLKEYRAKYGVFPFLAYCYSVI